MRSFRDVLSEKRASKDLLSFVGDMTLQDFWRVVQFPSEMAWIIENCQYDLDGMPSDESILLGAAILCKTALEKVTSPEVDAVCRQVLDSIHWNQSTAMIHDRLVAKGRLSQLTLLGDRDREIRWAFQDLLRLFDERRWSPVEDSRQAHAFTDMMFRVTTAICESPGHDWMTGCLLISNLMRQLFPLHLSQPKEKKIHVEQN